MEQFYETKYFIVDFLGSRSKCVASGAVVVTKPEILSILCSRIKKLHIYSGSPFIINLLMFISLKLTAKIV